MIGSAKVEQLSIRSKGEMHEQEDVYFEKS